MDTKPTPKPRSIISDRPVPAPRNIPSSNQLPAPTPIVSTSPQEESLRTSQSEDQPRTLSKSPNSEFFKNLSSSSRQLKEEISGKVSSKGRAVISSTKSASIRLEKSVKNLLTRRLTSVSNQEEDFSNKKTEHLTEERCISMPPDDVLSRISFYGPLGNNLRSVKNEEDLTEARYSPPPPVYPPPPLPDESIYDELQSVTSMNSNCSRYDTLSSNMSEQESFNLSITSDQELSLSDLNNERDFHSSLAKRLSRSDSWTFYDGVKSTLSETIDDDADDEDDAGYSEKPIVTERISNVSIPNSLYENWSPGFFQHNINNNDVDTTSADTDSKRENSKSLLIEFDPFAKTDTENVYNNYQNNDLLLLEALLSTDSQSSTTESNADLHEFANPEVEESKQEEDEEELDSGAGSGRIQIIDEESIDSNLSGDRRPPDPPKRFDSLPKNEYDEVEAVEGQQQQLGVEESLNFCPKNPALLPKVAQISKGRQPAVPPRDHLSNPVPEGGRKGSANGEIEEQELDDDDNEDENNKDKGARRSSVMERLKKLRHDSSVSVKPPNVFNFVKSKRKLLSRSKSDADTMRNSSSDRCVKMSKPKFTGQHLPVHHRGIVYKTGAGIERAKDLVLRAAVLTEGKLCFYLDKSMTNLKETMHTENIHSIHLLQDAKLVNGETVHCIALNGDGRPSVHVFYAKGITERRIWAQRILESLTPVFPVKYTADITRVGWAYLKEGVTGTWFPAWLLLQQRTLIYTSRSMDPGSFEQIDLRKARCILLRDEEGPLANGEKMQVVVVDAGGRGSLHVAPPGPRESSAWRHALYQAAVNCGPSLEQQQLTQDNVPVILDKCINFIYAHGIMSEGIYRRSGSSSAVARLLEAFRRDAWATQIARGTYTEHDVATVLRRFLRDLPDPLFPTGLHQRLCRATDTADTDERVSTYRKLLSTLNPISFATLRRILAHLHCLTLQSSRNLMTVENISAIWGPTLMHAGENNAEEWNRSESIVIGDLIKLYPKLYQLSEADLAKEAKMLQVLEKHHVSNSNGLRVGAPSGDLKIWIYILSNDGKSVNVTISPHKTAYDVCLELAEKAHLPAHELCLEEYALSGMLQRPLHHSEKVLEVVARWGYWDPDDRRNNVLIIRKDHLYKDIVPLVAPPMTISGELKFADTKSKNWKNYLFEFSQAKLCCYKDKVCSVKLHEWKIEDIVWYLGHETKRNPQMGWSITFIVKNQKPARCKENPYFGNTLAGVSKDEQYRWLAAMLFGEYQMNLRPSAINLMDP